MGREAVSQQGQPGRGQQAGGLGLPEGVTLEARLGLALSELQRLNARIDTLERGRAAETGAAAGQQAGGPAEAMVRELEAAGGAHQPFVRDPMGVTNATAGAVPGLDDLANRLLRASGTMPLGTAVPIRIAGLPGGAAATGQAGVAAARESAVLVPLFPALPENYCDAARYSSGRREQQLQFVTDPLTGQASVIAAHSSVAGFGSKGQKGPEALLKCLPGPVQYIMADAQLLAALS
ncbi:hypothetical protein ABPG75_001578 [Micractinium tetrahymenae]